MVWHVFTDALGNPDVTQGAFAAPQAGTIEIPDAQYASLRAALPAPPTPDWDGFNAYILTNVGFQSAMELAPTALSVALPSAYRDVAGAIASNDTGKVLLFSTIWEGICTAGSTATAQRDTWANKAAEFNLPPELVAVVRG